MNKTTLIGRLTKDPQKHTTANNKSVAMFTLAVNRRQGKSDNNTQNTDFIPVIAWEKLADVVINNLSKGRRVMVDGRIQTRQYEAKDGTKRYVTEVVANEIEFLDSKTKTGEETHSTPFVDSTSVEEVPF